MRWTDAIALLSPPAAWLTMTGILLSVYDRLHYLVQWNLYNCSESDLQAKWKKNRLDQHLSPPARPAFHPLHHRHHQTHHHQQHHYGGHAMQKPISLSKG